MQPSPASAADQGAADADQTAADTDQTLSDADQTLSDSDQAASESDQAQADADQRASERDQSAAERESAVHDPRDFKSMQALALSHADRAQATAERLESAEKRAHTMFDRAEVATQRDQQATLRDLQAAARDRSAELRDRAAEEHESAFGRRDAELSRARATAADDRARAAQDRARAAEDREQAARDRAQAIVQLEKAQLDDLTGFYRLSLGRAILQREIDRCRRSGRRLVLVYCDVDGLKRVNDEKGHAAGDALLTDVAKAIRSRLRSYDPVVRVGGDEFVCAISETNEDQVEGMFRGIQASLAKASDRASVSFGLASMQEGDDLEALLERGDCELRMTRSASP
jgi:diguanylate cyclase (GGDEF)-like protein